MKHHTKLLLATLIGVVLAIAIGPRVADALNPGTWTTAGVVAIQANPTPTTDRNAVVTVSTADRYQNTKLVDANVASTAAIDASKLATGTILNANIAATAAITPSKLAPGTAGQFLINSTTPALTSTTLSGDVTASTSSPGSITVAKVNGATAPASPSAGQTYYSFVASGAGAYTLGDSRTTIAGWSGTDLGSTTSVRFIQLGGISAVASVEATSQMILARGGTLSNFYVYYRTTSAGQNATFTVNTRSGVGAGTNSALTCTINAGGQTCSDVTHSVAVSAGDLVSVQQVAAGSDATVIRSYAAMLLSYGP